MVIVLMLVAICELLFGVATFASAKSAIHEILAALMVGFAFLTFALASILEELKRSRKDGLIHVSE